MFLIIDQQETGFGLKLKSSALRKGIRTIYLTSKTIVHDILIDYRLTDHDEKFVIRADNFEIDSEDIYGVYCGLNNFWPELWPDFSNKDAQYAVQETFALWLAMLSGLSCRLINQPAMDTLAGSLLSVPETLSLAQKHGLRIPLSLTLESGEAATSLLMSHSSVQFVNLGDKLSVGDNTAKEEKTSINSNDNHCRITEVVPGRLIYIARIGERLFCSSKNGKGLPAPLDIIIPDKVYAGLQKLQKGLKLNMAEFYFRLTADQSWVFSGYGRVPEHSVAAFGDDIIDYIVDYAIGNGGS